jgi:hypothetical protein
MTAKIQVCVWLMLLVNLSSGDAQPVASSKQIVENIEVYRDLKNMNLFYYAPGDLKLALEADDKPRFQLLEMRYTGSSAYGDNGEKRFMNVIQFSVAMQQVSAAALQLVKQKLNQTSIDLRPLPVRNIDAFLVAPVGEGKDGSAYKKIGKDGTFQAEGKEGASGKNGFWTERTFTLKLENHEAQLLWDQVATGKLALSLGYAFYADMVQGGKADLDITGDSILAENFETATEHLLTVDTLAVTRLIKADAFPVRVDVAKWPGLLKKIDINEGVPPGYAAFEVRCFDFANDLRPDLAVKGIDISAMGVGGQTVTLPTQKFLRSEPDLFAKQIRFPYAVKLTQPYRYRIIEYTVDGSKQISEWKTANSWTSQIDITTPEKENAFLKKDIDIEVPLKEFAEKGVAEVAVGVNYTLAGKTYNTLLTYKRDEEIPIKALTFKCDKGASITYEVRWIFDDETTRTTGRHNVTEDNYLYLIIPER